MRALNRAGFTVERIKGMYPRLRAGERTGPPLGDGGVTHRLDAMLGRRIQRQKSGLKPGTKHAGERRELPKR
ncbi:MAG TPA: hypothetical protein VLE23_07360 [Geminicoccaceae bacterium]|nr:hypothetical protein [Geminicoccaceae bacterium]